MARTVSPTDVEFYAGHAPEALRSIVAEYTATSLQIALAEGADHVLSVEAMATANAAWMALVLRGES